MNHKYTNPPHPHLSTVDYLIRMSIKKLQKIILLPHIRCRYRVSISDNYIAMQSHMLAIFEIDACKCYSISDFISEIKTFVTARSMYLDVQRR